ncbi:hypothetical protein SAMN05428948_0444 [Massilia sp. CF038]|nr:hypothetical protein SAMN05428948_0444 [Massilia sp. CF038]
MGFFNYFTPIVPNVAVQKSGACTGQSNYCYCYRTS